MEVHVTTRDKLMRAWQNSMELTRDYEICCLLALVDHTLSDCNDIALKGWDGSTALGEGAQLRFFRYWLDREAFLNPVWFLPASRTCCRRTSDCICWTL